MDWNKFWELFHKVWGYCKESPEYDKKVFNEIQTMLQNLQAEKRNNIIIKERRKMERRKL